MNPWEACQQVYANVEKEQSPSGRGGFQTLFYTHGGLTESEVEEIEARMLYFASESERIKRVFYVTSSGRPVVAQIIGLPDTDRAGRKGRYLAHCLTFNAGAAELVASRLFGLFDCFSFVTTVDQALAQGDWATGNIPALTVALPDGAADDPRDAAQSWPVAELRQLGLLGLRAEKLASQQSIVALIGQPEEIERALRAVFLIVPSALLRHCTFDTGFYRCNVVGCNYWAVGLPERTGHPRFVEVDASRRRVLGQVAARAESIYESWFLDALAHDGLTSLAGQKEFVLAVCRWLEGDCDDVPEVDRDSEPLLESLLAAHPALLRKRVQAGLARQLPGPLAARVLGPVCRQYPPLPLYRSLERGFDVAGLLERLDEDYAAHQYRPPAEEEINALNSLLENRPHDRLNAALALWSAPRQRLREALQKLDDDPYRDFVQSVLRGGTAEPLALLVGGRGDAFLDGYLPLFHPRGKELVALTQELLSSLEIRCLSRLAPLVRQCPVRERKQLKPLETIVEQDPSIPEDFRHAVAELAETHQSTGWTGRLLGLLGLAAPETTPDPPKAGEPPKPE